MNSIAVTKPDMAVMKRDRLGLSLFGLLALAFGNEISTRSTWNAGWYREIPLDLLEQEEAAPSVPARPEPVQIKVDLKGMLDKLQKEPSSTPRMTPADERILERIYLLERRIERQTSVYPHMTVHLEPVSHVQQAGSYPHGRNAGSEKERSYPEKDKQLSRPDKALDRVGERLIRMVQSGAQPDRGRAAMRITQLESFGRLSAPLTPVVSSTAAPAQGGWAPRWQEEHPGFPQKGAQQEQSFSAGSILLPDLLRQRRKQAVEGSQTAALHDNDGLLHRAAVAEQPQDAVSTLQRQDGMRELVQRLDRAVDQVIARSQTRSAGQQRASLRQQNSSERMQDDDLDRDTVIHVSNRTETQTVGNAPTPSQFQKAPNETAQDKMEQPGSAVQENRSTASMPQTGETVAAMPVEQTVHIAQNFATDGAEQLARPIPYTDAAMPTTEEELHYRQEASPEVQPDSGVASKAHAEKQTNAASRTPSQHDPRTVQAVGEKRAKANPAASEELHHRQEQAAEAQPDSGVASKAHAEKQTNAEFRTPSQHDPRTMQVVGEKRAEADLAVSEELYHRQEQAPEVQPDSGVASKAQAEKQTNAASRTPSQHDPRTVQAVGEKRAEGNPAVSEELYHRQEQAPEVQPDSGVASKAQAEKQTNAVSGPQPRREQRTAQTMHPERATVEQTSGAQVSPRQRNTMKTQSDSAAVSETNAYLQPDDVSRTPIQRDPRTMQAVGAEREQANPAASAELYHRQGQAPEAQPDRVVAAKAHTQKQTNDGVRSLPHVVPRTVQTTDKGRAAETVRTTQASDIRTPHDHQTPQSSPVRGVVGGKTSVAHTVVVKESETDTLQMARAVARPAETATIQHAEILQHRTPLDEAAVLPLAHGNQPNKQTTQPMAQRTALPITGHPVQAHRASPMRPYRAAETVFRPIISVQQTSGRTSVSPVEPTIPVLGGEPLTYLPVQNGAAQATRAAETPAALQKNTAQLPDWAQHFLQQPMQPASAAQQGSAVQYPAAAGAQPPAAKRTAAPQIEWTAPNAMPSAASIVYAEHKPQPAQPPQQAARLSDSELHRAADKVYRIIEERLRKELRRSGK